MLKVQPKHIVFVGHEATISGAPILLLNLLLLLQQEKKVRISVVLRRDGPLTPIYRQHFAVIVLKPAGYSDKKNISKRFADICKNRVQLFRAMRLVYSCDVVFNNTIVNGKLLKTLRLLKKPVVTYVHELENVIKTYLPTGDSSYTLRHSRLFAFPSQKVKEVLQNSFSVSLDKLYRLSYYFPVNKEVLQDETAKTIFAQNFRDRFGINNCDLLVGAMGRINNRKGIDLFIEVCKKIVAVNKNIKFCWIGEFETLGDAADARRLIDEYNLTENLVFTGGLEHTYYNAAAFDILFLSSREDPYPLVVIEAAFMQVPSICFEWSGGITEFVGDDAGWIVPEYSTDQAAETLLRISNRKDLLREKGKTAFQKSIEWHANRQLVLGQFETIINQV